MEEEVDISVGSFDQEGKSCIQDESSRDHSISCSLDEEVSPCVCWLGARR